MTNQPRYLLDADSLIRAKREHYAFDFCPGFWDALLQASGAGQTGSIEPIRKELMRGKDALANWVETQVPSDFFETVADTSAQAAYAKVVTWVEGSDRYSRAAKQQFMSGADPWLVAVAAARERTVVTYEVPAPESKARIKLPDVARHFQVPCVAPYVMLRRLKIVLRL